MPARLIVESGHAQPSSCELPPGEIVRLGRNRRCHIVLLDEHASREHAELYRDADGRWFLRDCVSAKGTPPINGTRVDGVRIQRPTPLRHGQVIAISKVRLLFVHDDVTTPRSPPPPEPPSPVPGLDEPTLLHNDELSSLFHFMSASPQQNSARALIDLALTAVERQTRADVCGFLSFDPDDPLPRLVRPARAAVDVRLSKTLTQRARQEGKTVWLASAGGSVPADGDSLASYRDALCVPLRPGEGGDAGPTLGALHVYRATRSFDDRAVRFCEVLGRCLADGLWQLRARRVLEADNQRLRDHPADVGDQMIGDGPALRRVRQQIERLADAPCSVILIAGESGVGKELVAAALHGGSGRRDGPLVTVNCGAIVQSMPEAQLFGYEKGAFTGADRAHPGYFQQADLGTLFLDEIGELSPECQTKLLRAIETHRFRPVGATEDVTVDVRVIAATNRDLEEEVRAGRFRSDLLYRLGNMVIEVPPLRQRREDIPALAAYLLRRQAERYRKPVTLSEAAVRRLCEYDWPGNVRQLRGVLEHALLMADGPVLEPGDLKLRGPAEAAPGEAPPSLNLKEIEAWAIRQALQRTGGHKTRAAQMLGIHRDTLGQKLREDGEPGA